MGWIAIDQRNVRLDAAHRAPKPYRKLNAAGAADDDDARATPAWRLEKDVYGKRTRDGNR
jgi:hypothetical protein